MAKVFKIAAIVSALLFLLSLAMFIAGWHFDAQYGHWMHVKDDLNIGLIHRGDFNIGLAIFGDSGPYSGGILALAGSDPFSEKHHFNAPGVYYRYFKFKNPGDGVVWTLRISLWYPMVAFAILPALWLVALSGIAPWLQWKFSLRTMLLVVSAVAVLLGIAFWRSS